MKLNYIINLILINRWGRGNPEEYTEAINLGGDDGRYDPLDDKKPRAGQILWIRGLTRLQTQVRYDKHFLGDASKMKNYIFCLSLYPP
jgi:Plasma membrane calcium transporter ATPase C terminal